MSAGSGPAARAVELLLDEARDATSAGRHARALAAVERAVLAARSLNEPRLLVRALASEMSLMRTLDDYTGVLRCGLEILAMARDPTLSEELSQPAAAYNICDAFVGFSVAARLRRRTPRNELLEFLDEADRWLTVVGHTDWRCAVLLERALVYIDFYEPQRALDAAQEAFATYSASAPGYGHAAYLMDLGLALAGVDRYGEAKAHFQAVVDAPATRESSRMYALFYLAECLAEEGDTESVRQYCDTALALSESQTGRRLVVSLTLRGLIISKIARFEEALEDLGRASELAADDPWVLAQRGYAYLIMNRYDCALVDFDRAVELNPHYACVLGSRARAYQEAGGYQGALADFHRALELGPEDPWTQKHIGIIHHFIRQYGPV